MAEVLVFGAGAIGAGLLTVAPGAVAGALAYRLGRRPPRFGLGPLGLAVSASSLIVALAADGRQSELRRRHRAVLDDYRREKAVADRVQREYESNGGQGRSPAIYSMPTRPDEPASLALLNALAVPCLIGFPGGLAVAGAAGGFRGGYSLARVVGRLLV